MVWESRGVYRRYFGRLTGAELIEAIVATQADARFDAIRYALNDCSGIDSVAITEDEFTRVAAAQFGAFHSNPNVSVAFVLNRPDLFAAFERFTESGSTPYRYEVFASLEAARLYLAHDDGRRQLRDRVR